MAIEIGRFKGLPCPWIVKINIVKIATLSNIFINVIEFPSKLLSKSYKI